MFLYSVEAHGRGFGEEWGTGKDAVLRAIQDACETTDALLEHATFGSLDFGEAAVLDSFYYADVALVEVGDCYRQPSLFYHVGVRESFNSRSTALLYGGTDPDTAIGLLDSIVPQASCGSVYTFLTYCVAPCGQAILCEWESGLRKQSVASSAIEHPVGQPNGPLLVERLVEMLQHIQVTSSARCKATVLAEIRRARRDLQGNLLAKELARIRQRLDTTELLSPDIVVNLLLSYRDVQDYDAMVKLVETLEMLPTCDLSDQNNIKFHYAFALNRRGEVGDRDKALSVMLAVFSSCNQPPSDMYCLCGRIYKDIFLESNYQDIESRDKAIYWYRKGFELEPSLYAGLHLSSLLIARGETFNSSSDLSRIGIKLNSLLGRQGGLERIRSYWDVGLFIGVCLLAGDYVKVVNAAEKLYHLHPPSWHIVASSPQVLIQESAGEYLPGYVAVNSETEERSVLLWLIAPTDTVTASDTLFGSLGLWHNHVLYPLGMTCKHIFDPLPNRPLIVCENSCNNGFYMHACIPGTLQYMAPEIIDRGQRGYGKPADIWSLGCTVIEMASSRPPFHELGEPHAAMFKVGMFKIHPEIPETLSPEARSFLLLCFEPEPERRAHTVELLQQPFLRGAGWGARRRGQKTGPDYGRSVSVPIHIDTSSTGSEHGSSSSDMTLFASLSYKSALFVLCKKTKRGVCSLPEEAWQGEEHSAPPSPDEAEPSLFLLRKDSERRATLHRILASEEQHLAGHLNQLLFKVFVTSSTFHLHFSLREFIRQPDPTCLATSICVLSPTTLCFHVVQVSKVLRDHNIKPHWVFALDNLVRTTVQTAASTLIPDLVLSLTCLNVTPSQILLFFFSIILSNGNTLSSSHLVLVFPGYSRLLEKLIEKEQEYHELLERSIEHRTDDIRLLHLRSHPIGTLCVYY
uniref:Protein kinase domain-containing protein n=1 Tax=Eptatretus burgeri TaxID=7764 RepID=A0A8C4Q3H4_EPTBU